MPNIKDWVRFHGTFAPAEDKQVDSVEFQIAIDDAVIRDVNNQNVPIFFTDVQFQPGNKLTGWVPGERELLSLLRYTDDEFKNRATVNDVYQGTQPQTRLNVEPRLYNLVGRGHTVITLPNYYPEDWTKEVLPTGVDFIIYPKEDFELMRISTNVGFPLPEEDWFYKEFMEQHWDNDWVQETFAKHPLHYRYTREFWVSDGTAGSEIKIHASTRTATLNGNKIMIVGDRAFDWDTGFSMPITVKRFMLAPKGSIRFRVEFYGRQKYSLDPKYPGGSRIEGFYLGDAGIGFYGTAEFKQWTYGRARI